MPTPVARIVQLTSSGVRNEGPAILRPLVRALPFGQGLLRGEPQARLGWKETAAIDLPTGSATSRPGAGHGCCAPRRSSPRAAGRPAPRSQPAPTGGGELASCATNATHDELPVSYPFQDPVAEFDPNEPLESFARIAARHADAALDRKDQVRVVVFMPNCATVSFRTVDGKLRVRQTLFSEASPGSALGAPNTVHEAELAAARGRRRPEARDRRLMAEPTKKKKSPSGSASSTGSSDALEWLEDIGSDEVITADPARGPRPPRRRPR